MKTITLPLNPGVVNKLKAGQEILLNGVIYTARDQAHKRIAEAIRSGRKLPIELKGAAIYYCGPTPAKNGEVIGSCGPTTSSRMDDFTPLLLKAGLKVTIGKGNRDASVMQAIKKYKAVYFLTYAGCGAFLSRFIKKRKVIAYPELGTEAIQVLKVENFPVIVAIDCHGNNIFE